MIRNVLLPLKKASGLVPFNMRIKGKALDIDGNIEYIVVNVYGSQVRIPSSLSPITIDGVAYSPPYKGFNGTVYSLIAGQLFIAFNFGFTIKWNENGINTNLIEDYAKNDWERSISEKENLIFPSVARPWTYSAKTRFLSAKNL